MTRAVAPVSSQAVASQASARVDIDCEDADLEEVMEKLGSLVGTYILVDPNVSESVTISLQSIPWVEAVEVVAKMTDCVVEDRGNGVLLLTRPRGAELLLEDVKVSTALELVAAYQGHERALPSSLLGNLRLEKVVVNQQTTLEEVIDRLGNYRVTYEESGLARVERASTAAPTSATSGDITSRVD